MSKELRMVRVWMEGCCICGEDTDGSIWRGKPTITDRVFTIDDFEKETTTDE